MSNVEHCLGVKGGGGEREGLCFIVSGLHRFGFVVWLGLCVSFAQEGFSIYLPEFKSNEKYAYAHNLLL